MNDTASVICVMSGSSGPYFSKANSSKMWVANSPTIPDDVNQKNIRVSPDGSVCASYGDHTGIIQKFSKNLELLWHHHEQYVDYWGDLVNDHIFDLAFDEDGNVYFVAREGRFKKLDATTGAEVWGRTTKWSSGDSIEMQHLIVDWESDSIYLSFPYTNVAHETDTGALQKYNKSGGLLWRQVSGAEGDVRSLHFDNEKNVIPLKSFDGWRRKYSPSGSYSNWWATSTEWPLFFLSDGSFLTESEISDFDLGYYSPTGEELKTYDDIHRNWAISAVLSTDGKEAIFANNVAYTLIAKRVNVENLSIGMPEIWELTYEDSGFYEYDGLAVVGGVLGEEVSLFWTGYSGTVEVAT